MARHNPISREARRYIIDQIFESGETTVDDVVELIRPMYIFDPEHAKEQEHKACARRILASIRNTDGVRVVLAVEGETGKFINIETCKNLEYMRKVTDQLDRKWKGLSKTRRKAHKNRAQLEGQLSMFEQERTFPAAAGV